MKCYRVAALLSFITVASLMFPEASSVCNECGANGIRCVNTTAFQICSNGSPITTQTFNCPSSGFCTNLQVKCSQEATPDCSASTCGCDGKSMFVCTSRTTFAQCNGTTRIKNGSCPSGLYCSVSKRTGTDICVDQCKLGNKYECDRMQP